MTRKICLRWFLFFWLGCLLLPSTGFSEEALEWYLKGNDLSQAGKFDEAVDAYQKSIQANPDATGPFYNMGLAYKQLRQYKRATAAIEAALRLEPDNLNIRLALGNIYNLREQWKDAISHLNVVVHRDPENAEAHGNLGWALLNFDKGPRFKMLVLLNLEKAVTLFKKRDMPEAAEATQKTLEQARQQFGYPVPDGTPLR